MAPHLIMSASYNALLAILLYMLDKKTAFSKTQFASSSVRELGLMHALINNISCILFNSKNI